MTEVDRVWYLRRSDGEGSVGPFSTEQLRDQWEKGLLEETAEAWKEGMPDWRPLAEIEPFAMMARVSSGAAGIIRFTCECGNQIVMSEKFVGRLAKCKACGRTVTVYDPSQVPEPEPKKQKKEKEEGRPVWVVPVAVVAGLIIVAGAIIYFAVSGATEEGAVATVPQDRGSRIARARNELLDDIDSEPRRRVRQPAKPTADPPDAPEKVSEKLVDADEGARDTGQTVADATEETKTTEQGVAHPVADQGTGAEESEPVDEPAQITGGPEEKAVRKLAREFAEAFRIKNPTPIERLEELLADDCVVVPSTGGLVEGKEFNMQAFTQAIEEKMNRFRDLRVRYAISWIRVFSDSAVTCGELVEQGALKARGKPFKEVLWTTMVFQKAGAQWRIIQVHYTPVARRHGPAG